MSTGLALTLGRRCKIAGVLDLPGNMVDREGTSSVVARKAPVDHAALLPTSPSRFDINNIKTNKETHSRI